MANLKDLVEDDLKYDGSEGTQYGNLTVIGWNGKFGNPKKYVVECSVCKEDAELHGEGLFAMMPGHLRNGGKPCGCAEKPNWTEQQYKIRLSRACSDKGISFVRWASGYRTAGTTALILECPDHGEYKGGVISSVLSPYNKESGCPGCFAIRMGNYKRKDDQVMIDKFMASGGYAEGTVFRRSDRVNKSGHKRYWYMYCPDCETEGEANMVGFYKGARCCNCTAQRPQETYINLLMDKENVVAIKFGVANSSGERIKNQNRRCTYEIVNYGVWRYSKVSTCRSAERACMKELECGVVSIELMPDGYTETTSPLNIDKVVAIFEREGGKRV